MSQTHSPQASAAPSALDTDDVENVSMQDSPSSKNSGFEGSDADKGSDNNGSEQDKAHGTVEEEILFEKDFQIPPSFGRAINEETLQDDDHPYVFWASLRLPIPLNPPNPMAAVYDALEEFMSQFTDEDPNFIVYPYKVSKYESTDDLPPPIETPDDIPDDVDDWLEYFPGAKPRTTGGDTYTQLLVGMSKPLPKVIKNLSAWMRNKKFGLWYAYLQSEQPTSLGWLLFSTQTMNVERLKEAISEAIDNVPVGLRWKTISHGTQGAIPKDQQVKALHILVDKLDVAMAKPLIMALYTSKPQADHQFPLHICM